MVILSKNLVIAVLLTGGLLSASANPDISPENLNLQHTIILQDTAMANQVLPRAVKLSRDYKFDEAQVLFEKIGNIYADKQHWLEQAYYLNMFSEHYSRMENFKLAEKLANEAIGVSNIHLGNQSESEATAYFNLGRIYQSLGQYKKSASFLLKGIAIYEKILEPDNKLIGHCYLALGSTRIKLGKYESALESYEKAMDIYKKEYTGSYCSGCERLVTEKDLIDGKCPEHPTRDIEVI